MKKIKKEVKFNLFKYSEREAGAGFRGTAAEFEAAGLSQQRGAPKAPEVHGNGSQVTGSKAAQRGQCSCASSATVCV